ncbi:hypothetical protein PoB_000454400 [Plakobranchus ocellatus]|uniref:Uncharacterized protein n=1 Tax=Plakobranchus ocellatus TaxID=259542 RepID=A0AAV3Y7I5_9GAST|nr:hypothetical protein PoB_000454400 [Plakobranchus ocellatus]
MEDFKPMNTRWDGATPIDYNITYSGAVHYFLEGVSGPLCHITWYVILGRDNMGSSLSHWTTGPSRYEWRVEIGAGNINPIAVFPPLRLAFEMRKIIVFAG